MFIALILLHILSWHNYNLCYIFAAASTSFNIWSGTERGKMWCLIFMCEEGNTFLDTDFAVTAATSVLEYVSAFEHLQLGWTDKIVPFL